MDSKNTRFRNFRACCDDAPAGTFRDERELRLAIGDAVDELARRAQALGLKPCNCDGAHNVEATIYEWLTAGSLFGAVAEGCGEHGKFDALEATP
jgi:hypothetical protein